VPDSVAVLERALFDFTARNRGPRAATATILPTLGFALRLPRPTWPAIDTTMTGARMQAAVAMMRQDTAALRRAARALDSVARATAESMGSDSGFSVTAADAYLFLGDSAAALRTLRFSLDTAALMYPYFPLSSSGFTSATFASRQMLLRADLAAAAGAKDEAREWYRRFVDAWAKADPELQPLVRRARARLQGLGGRE
jgi:hypothetical protein